MPSPLRLRVFQHVPQEGLGSLEPFFVARGADIAYTRFFAGEHPPATSAFDFLIILGGPMNVYEEEKYPWLAAEKAAIKAALDAGKPVLGLCLGAQLMSVALGGEVTRNAHREIGWWPVEKLPGATGLGDHWAAENFPDRFTTFHWHGDTFSIPPGATLLFRSEGCAHQGFAWGDRAVALQFHPEITPEAITKWIAEAEKEGGGELARDTFVQDAASMRAAPGDFAGNHAWMGALCDRLIRAAFPPKMPNMPKPPETSGPPVIFFDGYCGLCNGFVDFVMARDRPGPREGGGARFRFAPLQGETAERLIPADAVPPPEPGDPAVQSPAPRSIVLWEGGAVYRKSEAVLRALVALGGSWKAARVLGVIPAFLRDGVYDFIARNRYRWFGRRVACRLPGPGERERFLA